MQKLYKMFPNVKNYLVLDHFCLMVPGKKDGKRITGMNPYKRHRYRERLAALATEIFKEGIRLGAWVMLAMGQPVSAWCDARFRIRKQSGKEVVVVEAGRSARLLRSLHPECVGSWAKVAQLEEQLKLMKEFREITGEPIGEAFMEGRIKGARAKAAAKQLRQDLSAPKVETTPTRADTAEQIAKAQQFSDADQTISTAEAAL